MQLPFLRGAHICCVVKKHGRNRKTSTGSYWQLPSSSPVEVSGGKEMIWNSKIKFGIKKKRVGNQTSWLWVMNACLLQSIPRRNVRSRGERRGFVWINMFFFFKTDVRNWDSGGIADVPGLGARQTRDTHTNAGMQTRTNTHLHTKRLGRPWGSPLSKRFQMTPRRISIL